MNPICRRRFLEAVVGSVAGSALFPGIGRSEQDRLVRGGIRGDVVVVGGGLGGVAAALAALDAGRRVVLTEPTDWIGGQLTQQGVPPDEHRWIESHGATATYRRFRTAIREHYRRHYPLTEEQRQREHLNPGGGSVSRLCHEPRVGVAVLEALLAPYQSSGKLTVLLEHQPVAASMRGDQVESVTVRNTVTGATLTLEAPWFIDASELGDLLPLTGTAFVTGAESKDQTGELHAADRADPDNQQAFTRCFAIDYDPQGDWTIPRPDRYAFWRDFVPDLSPPWPGRLLDWTYTHPSSLRPKELGFDPTGAATPGTLNLWLYRRMIARSHFEPGTFTSDITLVNWPQNDYFLGNLIGVTDQQRQRHVDASGDLSLSLLYWMQTEAPRPDGGNGWPGLRLRRDVMGTDDGLAKYPYIRESRRIVAEFTILEEDCGRENRALVTGEPADRVVAAEYPDSVGVGSYHIDLHPSSGGDNYIDFPSLPFQIPLGAMLPRQTRNLVAACKNVGTTHVTNGCYRLHPVEWNLGESAGALVAFCDEHDRDPKSVRGNAEWLADFQNMLRRRGVELSWPER